MVKPRRLRWASDEYIQNCGMETSENKLGNLERCGRIILG
jgi:hypothetical protein